VSKTGGIPLSYAELKLVDIFEQDAIYVEILLRKP
jgi:hypothetical protein